jgi:hypothetical protein
MRSVVIAGGVSAAILWLGFGTLPFGQKAGLLVALTVLSLSTLRLIRTG